MDNYPHQDLTRQIIGAAMQVHSRLRLGLLENVYKVYLAEEFLQRGIAFEQQVPRQAVYGSRQFDAEYRLDFH